MPRSRLAVGRGQDPASQLRAAFTPRPAGRPRRGGEGRGRREHRQPCRPGGEPPPNRGCVPQPLLARSPARRHVGSAAFVLPPSSLPSSHSRSGSLHLLLNVVPRQMGSARVRAHIPVVTTPARNELRGSMRFPSPRGFCRGEKSSKTGR